MAKVPKRAVKIDKSRANGSDYLFQYAKERLNPRTNRYNFPQAPILANGSVRKIQDVTGSSSTIKMQNMMKKIQ